MCKTAVAALIFTMAYGHGYMKKPVARNVINDRSNQQSYNTDVACGKASYNVAQFPYRRTPSFAVLPAGKEFEVKLVFTANHGGPHHLRFTCMDDKGNTAPGSIPEDQWEWLEHARSTNPAPGLTYMEGYPCEVHIARYSNHEVSTWWKAPQKECSKGVLEWQWETDNSGVPYSFHTRCGQKVYPEQEYGKRFNVGNRIFCPTCEKFRNCADVSVGNGGNAPVTPRPTATPPNSKNPQPSDPTSAQPGDAGTQDTTRGPSNPLGTKDTTRGPSNPFGTKDVTRGPRNPLGSKGTTRGPSDPSGTKDVTSGPSDPSGTKDMTSGAWKPWTVIACVCAVVSGLVFLFVTAYAFAKSKQDVPVAPKVGTRSKRARSTKTTRE